MDNLSNASNNIHPQHQSLIHSHLPLDIISEICSHLLPKEVSIFVTVCSYWHKLGLACVWKAKIKPLGLLVNQVILPHPIMNKYEESKKFLSTIDFKKTPSSLVEIYSNTAKKVSDVVQCLGALTSVDRSSVEEKVKNDDLAIFTLVTLLKKLEEAKLNEDEEDRNLDLVWIAIGLGDLEFGIDKAIEILSSISNEEYQCTCISRIASSAMRKDRLLKILKIVRSMEGLETRDQSCHYIVSALIEGKMFSKALAVIEQLSSEKLKEKLLIYLAGEVDAPKFCKPIFALVEALTDKEAHQNALWYLKRTWAQRGLSEGVIEIARTLDDYDAASLFGDIVSGYIRKELFQQAYDFILGITSKKQIDPAVRHLMKAFMSREDFKNAETVARLYHDLHHQGYALHEIVEALCTKGRFEEAMKLARSILVKAIRNNAVKVVSDEKKAKLGSDCSVM